MSGGMPQLGSKISLISKADIRYEGRLFTVDPTECTIALASVRSYGTEDREVSYPILPQPTVYDYILFRGSDIKDIRVVNNVALPHDPAIMQMQPPQQQNFPSQNFPNMQQAGGAPPMNQFGAFGMHGMGTNMPPQNQQQGTQSPVQSQQQGNANNSNLAPGSGSGQKSKKSSELSKSKELTSEKPLEKSTAALKSAAIRKQNNKSQDSRSGTPQNVSRKSPANDSSSQTNQNQRENQSGKDKTHPNQRNNQRNNNQQRERRDSGRNEAQENKSGYRNQNQRPHNQMNNHQQPQQQQHRGYQNNRNNNNNNQMRGNQGGSVRMRGPPMHQNNYRQQNNQGAPVPNNQNKPSQPRGNNKPNTLKFDSEFDFEQANSQFEELRSELAKLKVGSEETKTPDQVNGEVEKKEDSGNETGADHEAEVDEIHGYDKNKSFFDNISCEAVERSKGKTQRTDWRQERKINGETFGYMPNRRGPYRGRNPYYGGNYRNQRQGGYRGGGYRSMHSHQRTLNNSDGRNNAPNNQGTATKSQNQSAPVAAN